MAKFKLKEKFNIEQNYFNLIYFFVKRLEDKNFYDKNYKSFSSDNEIGDWGKSNYSNWVKKLYDEFYNGRYLTFPHKDFSEYEAIQYYAGFLYRDINYYLRNGRTSGWGHSQEYVEKLIKFLDSALEGIVLTHNIIAFRWMSCDGFRKWTNNKRVRKGDVFFDNGFISTALDIHITSENNSLQKDILLVLRIPKGTRGAYINDISRRSFEAEFLLNRGVRFCVSKVILKFLNKGIYIMDII